MRTLIDLMELFRESYIENAVRPAEKPPYCNGICIASEKLFESGAITFDEMETLNKFTQPYRLRTSKIPHTEQGMQQRIAVIDEIIESLKK